MAFMNPIDESFFDRLFAAPTPEEFVAIWNQYLVNCAISRDASEPPAELPTITVDGIEVPLRPKLYELHPDEVRILLGREKFEILSLTKDDHSKNFGKAGFAWVLGQVRMNYVLKVASTKLPSLVVMDISKLRKGEDTDVFLATRSGGQIGYVSPLSREEFENKYEVVPCDPNNIVLNLTVWENTAEDGSVTYTIGTAYLKDTSVPTGTTTWDCLKTKDKAWGDTNDDSEEAWSRRDKWFSVLKSTVNPAKQIYVLTGYKPVPAPEVAAAPVAAAPEVAAPVLLSVV